MAPDAPPQHHSVRPSSPCPFVLLNATTPKDPLQLTTEGLEELFLERTKLIFADGFSLFETNQPFAVLKKLYPELQTANMVWRDALTVERCSIKRES